MSKDSKDLKREILGMSTLSHKFQVTIPKKVREKQELRANDTVMFIQEQNGRIYITRSTDV